MSEEKFPESFYALPRIKYIDVANFDMLYNNEWHNSHYNDLIYIISGNMTVELSGSHKLEYPIKSGEILLMTAGVRHKDIFTPSKGLKSLVISYLWEGENSFLGENNVIRKIEQDKLFEIRNILEHISENCSDLKAKNTDVLLVQQSRLHTVLLLLYNIMNGEFLDLPAKKLAYKPQKLLKAAEYYIQCNYSDPKLTRIQLADALSVSVATLTRAFERYCGYTFVEYLTRVRLEAAKKMLRNGNCMVSEAALMCGFTDPGYFARVFKKTFGTSPGNYR